MKNASTNFVVYQMIFLHILKFNEVLDMFFINSRNFLNDPLYFGFNST
jgi:hypothetical protein